MTITSLNAQDTRTIESYVAGPAALLIAKAHKLYERIEDANRGKPQRLSAKDAGDVYRIMITIRPAEVAASFAILRSDPRVSTVTEHGLEFLHALFGAPATPGTELAVQALAPGDVPEARIRALVPAYIADLNR
ncbi:hypothetical protein ACFYO5_11345 [Streptomyces sp. NPDC006259]|uniref:hypothetical protein n=1 Tax=Streptomyces sp. NPDC006259 TaxID=3364740 RepID=UPI0036CF7C83